MNALCTAPSRAVRNPTTRGESCGFVDESYGDRREPCGPCGQPVDNADALPTACPHSRASRPQAPQDQPPVILTRQHRTTLRRGCLHRPFRTTSASHSNPSQHRPRPGSPPILQAHFRMGLDCDQQMWTIPRGIVTRIFASLFPCSHFLDPSPAPSFPCLAFVSLLVGVNRSARFASWRLFVAQRRWWGTVVGRL